MMKKEQIRNIIETSLKEIVTDKIFPFYESNEYIPGPGGNYYWIVCVNPKMNLTFGPLIISNGDIFPVSTDKPDAKFTKATKDRLKTLEKDSLTKKYVYIIFRISDGTHHYYQSTYVELPK